MITQAIKRWLHSVFAWWSWQQSPETDYTETGGSLNTGTAQETIIQTTVDGPTAQPGITSVAVEHIGEEPASEPSRSTIEERSDRNSHVAQPSSPVAEESSPPREISRISSDEIAGPLTTGAQEVPAPTPQQRLEFLRYLVERGLVNEDFGKGQRGQEPRR